MIGMVCVNRAGDSVTYQVQNICLQRDKVIESHKPSIQQRLLQPFKELCQDFLLRSIEHFLYVLVFHGRNSHGVDGKHESLNILRGALQVRRCLDDLALNTWDVCDFEERVDIVDVYLPELEDVDGGRVVACCGLLSAREHKGEAVVVGEHFVKCPVNGRLVGFIFRGVVDELLTCTELDNVSTGIGTC